MLLRKQCRPQQLSLICLKHWRRRRIYLLAFVLLALAAKFQRLFATPRWMRKPRRKYDHKLKFKTTKGDRRDKKSRVLYIPTSLSEYDNGRRNTLEGFDRFQETLVPVVSESVNSMLHAGFKVDVYLIAHYNVTRSHLLRQALPDSVGLQLWEDASPLGYRLEEKQERSKMGKLLAIGDITRALARQHRFVIKDKLPYYDMFVSFEDDMLIKADAIIHWMNMTDELYRLRDLAPDIKKDNNYNQEWDEFYGILSKRQLSQLIPGFIRVESLLDPSLLRRKNWLPEGLIPVSSDRPDLDPEPCCWLNASQLASPSRPMYPDSDELYIWETNVRALGIRKMPLASIFDWVVLQRGRRTLIPDKAQQQWVQIDVEIGDYWAGRNGNFEVGYGRPDTKQFVYLNNQGGWMATRQQLWEWHTDFCQGGFLPPFESPHYNLDGLDMRNVEYWSGGLNIFTLEHGCNLQRIISLDPDRFAAQLLYHTSNNKQRHLTGAKQIKFTNVNDFLGQLHTVRNNAKAEMARRLEALRKKQDERLQT
ncbi:unnamed protein product [Cylindrotheca closterium]|uniref:Uncharacterized protein n=1 Tax=Cylindrotheca closterium TaxID=2856 RepID=A0AAD2FRD2_9STRA|nr:unnamed protein product [Cylindrotheca closterium]